MKKFLILILVIYLFGILSSANQIVEQEIQGNLSSGELPSQEVAAFYEFNYNFETGLENVLCNALDFPKGMTFTQSGSKCYVWWDGTHDSTRPTNNQKTKNGHKIIINAVNNESSLNFYFNIKIYSWIIPLEEGWNLISIPLVPEEDNSIENVILDQLGDEGQDVLPGGTEYVVYSYQYDGESSDWLKSRASGYGDLDTVMPGYAYWIKVTDDAVLKGMGVKSDILGSPTPEIKVPTNTWTMIGRYGIIGDGTNIYVPDSRVHGALGKFPALSSIMRGEENKLSTYGLDSEKNFIEINKLYNNEGYWLFIENRGNYTSSEETYSPLPEDDKYYLNN